MGLLDKRVKDSTDYIEEFVVKIGTNDNHDQYIVESISDKFSTDILGDFVAYRFDENEPFDRPEPIITFADVGIGRNENIIVLSGPIKAGKSSIIYYGILTDILGDGKKDSLGFKVKRNTEKLALIHIDTEQDRETYKERLHLVKQKAGIDKFPDWFHSYNFKGVGYDKLIVYLRQLIYGCQLKYEGVFMIIIDGIADFCLSPNNEQEGYKLVLYLEAFAKLTECPIVVIIHTNKTNEFIRGHLGSQLERKSETRLEVKNSNNEFIIECKYARNSAPSQKIVFGYEQGARYPTLKRFVLSGEKNKSSGDLVNVRKIFKNKSSLTRKELLAAIEKTFKVVDRQKYNVLHRLERLKLIEYSENEKVYSFTEIFDTQDGKPGILP